MPSSPTFSEQRRADAAKLERLAAQGEFDFLMPYGERRTLLNAQEVALSIGRSVDFVYEQIENGQFAAHDVPDRKRTEYRITRLSVLIWLARTAQYEPAYFLDRVLKCVDALTPSQCDAVLQRATQRRARL